VALPIGLGAGLLAPLVALAACAALAGCGLTADYSGLQGGGHDSGLGTGDGASSVPDASILPDAADAADASDASDALDASAGSEDAPDSAASFCASLSTAVKLCTDFDEGEQITMTDSAGWNYTDEYGGAVTAVSTVQSFSPPASFFSTVNPSGAPSSARLEENLLTTPSSVHIEFEMLLTPSTTGTLELAALHEVLADGTTYGLFYREVNGALQADPRRRRRTRPNVADRPGPLGLDARDHRRGRLGLGIVHHPAGGERRPQ